MRLRIAFAVVACAVLAAGALATGGPTGAALAATGYVPHRCYVSDLAAGFHGSQAGLGNRGFLLAVTALARHTPYFP